MDIVHRRKQFADKPLQVSWCLAHKADDIPCHLITPKIAAERGCDFLDLLCNKKADAAAKRAALQQCSPKFLEDKVRKIKNWQIWLSRIHAFISKDLGDKPLRTQQPIEEVNFIKILPYQISIIHPVESFKHLLPRWHWSDDPNTYLWTPSCDMVPFPNTHATVSNEDWDTILHWMLNLKWKQGPNLVTSWLELASQAWHCGVRLSIKQSPKMYMQQIQKVINQEIR